MIDCITATRLKCACTLSPCVTLSVSHLDSALLSTCSIPKQLSVFLTHPHGPVVSGVGVSHGDPVGPTLRCP